MTQIRETSKRVWNTCINATSHELLLLLYIAMHVDENGVMPFDKSVACNSMRTSHPKMDKLIEACESYGYIDVATQRPGRASWKKSIIRLLV